VFEDFLATYLGCALDYRFDFESLSLGSCQSGAARSAYLADSNRTEPLKAQFLSLASPLRL
jgi:hypothetical protein